MRTSRCATCGGSTDEHDRHVRFTLPDPLLDPPLAEDDPGVWMSGANPRDSVMLQVQGQGAFVRALLPVRLSGGHSVTFGVWVAIDPRELPRVFETWWSPEYPALTLDGLLANEVSPWGLLGASVSLRVRDTDHTPYCDSSSDARLSHVLAVEWEHDEVRCWTSGSSDAP